MEQLDIKHISQLNNDCLQGLELHRHEINTFYEHIKELAWSRHGDKLTHTVQQFQKSFADIENSFEELAHLISSNNKSLVVHSDTTNEIVRDITVAEHEKLSERFFARVTDYTGLREQFTVFAAVWK